jgi:hypothetical protein
MASMPARETQPRVFAVRNLTVPKVDSIGFVVRMCCQCSARYVLQNISPRAFAHVRRRLHRHRTDPEKSSRSRSRISCLAVLRSIEPRRSGLLPRLYPRLAISGSRIQRRRDPRKKRAENLPRRRSNSESRKTNERAISRIRKLRTHGRKSGVSAITTRAANAVNRPSSKGRQPE